MIDGQLRAAIKYDSVIINGQGASSHPDLTDRDVADQHPMSAITGLEDTLAGKADSADLAAVATSGDYDDLTGKPDLSVYAESSDLAAVATTGDYDDLSNKPTIPTVPTDVSAFVNDAGYITAADIANKQDKPTEVTTGTTITLADNTEYRLANVSTLTLTYPSGNFECWLRIETAASGSITITLPTSQYIGDAPNFGNGETWELSIKDGVVIAAQVT